MRGDQVSGELDQGVDSISFGFRLSGPPQGHFIKLGDTPPAECPGTFSQPEAAPGHLCVYQSYAQNILGTPHVCDTAQGRCDVGNFPGTTTDGAAVYATVASNGSWLTQGTWAVTSP